MLKYEVSLQYKLNDLIVIITNWKSLTELRREETINTG